MRLLSPGDLKNYRSQMTDLGEHVKCSFSQFSTSMTILRQVKGVAVSEALIPLL